MLFKVRSADIAVPIMQLPLCEEASADLRGRNRTSLAWVEFSVQAMLERSEKQAMEPETDGLLGASLHPAEIPCICVITRRGYGQGSQRFHFSLQTHGHQSGLLH